MEQRFEGTPHADIRLEGRRVIPTDVTGDWGSRLQWEVKRAGQVVGYKKDANGEFTESKFEEVSNKVTYTI